MSYILFLFRLTSTYCLYIVVLNICLTNNIKYNRGSRGGPAGAMA